MKYFIFIVLIVTYLKMLPQGSEKCLLYNGTNNYTEIPDNSLFSSHAGGNFSVEAWIKVI